MKYKKIMFMLVLAIFIFGAASVCASEVNDTVIASEDDSSVELSQADTEEMISSEEDELIGQTENEIISEGNSGTFSELQSSINTMSGSTLTLNKSYINNDDFSSEGITIDRPLTIDGQGNKIDAQGKSRIFKITAENVILKNIIFTNGKTTERGGAVYFSGSGTVTNCNFTDNTAKYYGGAVYFNSNGEVTNCNFTGNTATGDGGAVFFNGKGDVTNCNFTNNKATGIESWGGAIRMSSGTVSKCNFTNNTATSNGGAIRMPSGTVSNCNFVNNKATGDDSYGGAIYIYSGTVTNCNFVNNTATVDGGAVYFISTGEVTNCNFTDNTANDDGGAVYFENSGNVTNCNFTDNTVTGDGGAIYFLDQGTVTNCNFTDNTAYRGGAVYFNSTGNVTNCNFTDNKATGTGDYDGGGAVYFYQGTGSLTNCNFSDNTATYDGGAVYFNSTGTVSNCNFADNTATYGGAVYFWKTGNVTNCNFTNNSASSSGGAVYFSGASNVTNCNFAGNTAKYGGAVNIGFGNVTNCNFTRNIAGVWGGAVYFYGEGNVTNCNFADNSASQGGAIFSMQWYTAADTCIFKRNSGDNVNTVIYPPTLNVDDFTTVYGSGEKLTFDLKTNSSIPVTNGNISISVYFKDNGEWVRNYTCLSGEGWIPDLPVGSYIAFFYTEYAEFQKINRTVTIIIPAGKYYINVTSVTTNNKTVNITAKTNLPKNITWEGKLLFILPNGTQINATYGANGTWWAEHTFDAYGEYKVNATYVGLDNVTVNNATITVNKIKTELSGNAITTTYNINKDLIITLKDSNGNPVSGAKLIVDLNGAKTYTTDSNGQVKVSTKGLAPNVYTAKVTFNGNTNYDKSTKDIKVTVKKATTKLTAKKKTFKTSVKTKKYIITLKDNTGKAIKKAKVTLKVKGKTYKATTNSKGKAVFKIKNLKKKGTFKATVTYKGNKYYNKVSKKAKIKVIVTFKTVSKGSKDKSTVKEIQQALKDHGYYLSYKGHYLKVDGKFKGCTERSVKEFQKDKGLKVTGKVDEKTAKKLGLI